MVELPQKFQAILNKLVATCEADTRVVAALLSGSYVQGTADEHSDLDFFLILADEAYDQFLTERNTFVRQLGQPLFLEDFDISDFVFAIFPGGAEVEIGFGREGDFGRIHSGPYKVLVDKKGRIGEIGFTASRGADEENVEALRRQVYWFWHDLSHFITAAARGQLWWAQGQLEALRRYCANLARLESDFADPNVGDDPYFKIELAVPEATLSPLEESFVQLEKEKMLQAAWIIVDYFQKTARALAEAHGVAYPTELEQVMLERLSKLNRIR